MFLVYIIVLIVLICILYILSTICRIGEDRMDAFRGWNYTHRGLHGNGVPENSMAAFRRAREKNYGIEFDVHLLADGDLGVMHESNMIRTTGREGRIEDLTAAQLSEYFLENTMQTIPEFGQVLQLIDGRVPLIVELKPVGNNHAQLCEKTCSMLDGYNGSYCVESFDPRCVYWLRKNRPDIVRGQITENFLNKKESKLPWVLKFMLTNLMFNFLTLPDFVAYQYADRRTLSDQIVRKLWKTTSVTWTLKNKREFQTAVAEDRIPIFENFEP